MLVGIDFEFLETWDRDNGTGGIHLISVGLVAEDGRTYYAVNAEMPYIAVWQHLWLRHNVVPHLPLREAPNEFQWLNQDHRDVKGLDRIAWEIRRFIQNTPDPLLVGYYSGFDTVRLAWMFGVMVDKPDEIPMWLYDIKQQAFDLGIKVLPDNNNLEHHALADAQWNLKTKLWLDERAEQQRLALIRSGMPSAD
ncbi:3'-5' exoribonuclease [Herbidospora galbida]|uniref:3'-5' exoribonuclease n=1 Tax=Herbidospora galbida TaxID=2575442 RepID=UPI00148573F4|nr:3'-5' exoribonuclease [Herbidospora galbida]